MDTINQTIIVIDENIEVIEKLLENKEKLKSVFNIMILIEKLKKDVLESGGNIIDGNTKGLVLNNLFFKINLHNSETAETKVNISDGFDYELYVVYLVEDLRILKQHREKLLSKDVEKTNESRRSI